MNSNETFWHKYCKIFYKCLTNTSVSRSVCFIVTSRKPVKIRFGGFSFLNVLFSIQSVSASHQLSDFAEM